MAGWYAEAVGSGNPGPAKCRRSASASASHKRQDDRGRAFTEDAAGMRVNSDICDPTLSDGLFSQPDLAQHKFRLQIGGLPQALDVGELCHDATPLDGIT
jgi:hypothetical protein